VIELEVGVSRQEVLRFVGYPGGEGARADVAARLDQLLGSAQAMLRPRGAWRVVDGETARVAGMPEPAGEVGVAVCTVGPEVEDEASRAASRGELVDALLLDAFGSAAAEAAADSLNQCLCDVASDRRLRPAPRVSPGYGAWDTAAQRALLGLLPIGELGIALTEGGMMVPRKSVSFAVSFCMPSAAQRDVGPPCRRCGLARCRHRMVGSDDSIVDCG
jgi:hypothetical protein